jgi:hypothetical protein
VHMMKRLLTIYEFYANHAYVNACYARFGENQL